MSSHYWAFIVMWTVFWFLKLSAVGGQSMEPIGPRQVPDVTKVNISQEEYTRKMNIYLTRLRENSVDNSVPELQIFNAEAITMHPKRKCSVKVDFPKFNTNTFAEVEQADLRVLVSLFTESQSPTVKVYRLFGTGSRELIEEKKIYLTQNSSKWCDFDVTSAVKRLRQRDPPLTLQLETVHCNNSRFYPTRGILNILAYTSPRRLRRSPVAGKHRGKRGNSTHEVRCKPKGTKCKLHPLKVYFRNFGTPETNAIVTPKIYSANYCKGRCPYGYNHATNHSRIQMMMHKLDSRSVPRLCCAPSKLSPLQVLSYDPHDYSRILVDDWENMVVTECGCS